MEEAAAQEGVRQFLLVVGGDEDQRAVLGLNQFPRLVAVELHAVNFTQQVVRELDVGLVNFVDQQRHLVFCGERLPQDALEDVVVNVLDALAAVNVGQLGVAQTAHGVVLVEALLCLGGGLDVPLQQWHVQRASYLFGQHGLAGAWLALDQQGALEGDGGVDRQHEVLGSDVVLCTFEFHFCGLMEKQR